MAERLGYAEEEALTLGRAVPARRTEQGWRALSKGFESLAGEGP